MLERVHELRSILIQLLIGLGLTRTRIMLTMAIIAAHKIEEEMILWVATFHGKEDTMTTQAFMSKLNELTDSDY